MSTTTIILLAIALAMDAFAVSLTTGVVLKKVSGNQTFRMAGSFGLFQAVMPLIGWSAGALMASALEQIDHYIAFSLLALIGGKMIYESMQQDEESKESKNDPTKGLRLFILAIATSIDALAVGFSLSLLQGDIILPALIIGIVAFGFSVIGLHLGRLVSHIPVISHYSERIGGGVLILIGLKILHEHQALTLPFL